MDITTKLDELYSLREDFSIIGITGRTGSGCTDVANILQSDFENLQKVIAPSEMSKNTQERKYKIVYDFNRWNWKPYKVIKYRNVLLLIMCQDVNPKKFKKHLDDYYVFSHSEKDKEKVDNVYKALSELYTGNQETFSKIKEFGDIRQTKNRKKLSEIASFFWGEFETFAQKVDDVLKQYGIVERTKLLHHTAVNFRKSGQAYDLESEDFNSIYYIAEVINRLIKGTKILQEKCHVVIDSLRNSLEINFFKERYSSFYLLAVKSDERKKRLIKEYGDKNIKIINRLLEIDDTEYKCNDFVKGHFFSPDVQNCIQKADYHVINQEREVFHEDFDSLPQQLLKLQGLIQQPGLVTPSSVERCMQLAYNAKLSSGCISRQVGAVITDAEFSVKSIGWNDVPRGAVPCALRNIKEIGSNPFGFSDFELGVGLSEKENRKDIHDNPDNPDNADIDKESQEFNLFLKSNYTEEKLDAKELGGINCPYCFKTAYNKFTGKENQVHTRSLHAEENAMMQISKYGGQPLNHGFLFTTASPCELCAKKAYQLGITNIYYIDPYPGISRSHILKQNIDSNPNMKMFHGAIGRGYIKLYEPFMAQKDEISILTSHTVSTPQKVKTKQLKDILTSSLKDKKDLVKQLDGLLKDDDKAFDNIINLLEKGLNS